MSAAADRARIRRASQQARNAMRELDLRLIEELQQLYTDTAEQIKARLAQAVDGNNQVPMAHLKELLRQIDDTLDALGQERNAVLARGLDQAAALGVRPYTLQGAQAVGATAPAAALETSAAMRISTEAVRQVLAFQAADGLTLADRVWRLDRGAKEVLGRAIGQAVVAGWDASRAATALMMSGQPVPLDVQARMNAGKLPALLQGADLLTAEGGELWKAERVFRTEINRAHGNAYMAGAEKTPGFVGFRFLLSPLHPKPDVCFRRGTLVTTRRGPVPIECVALGDEVLTHLGRWRPVVKLYRSASGQNGLVRLRFPAAHSHSRGVVMTPNHPVLTPQGWTPAGDLQTGAPVVCLGPVAQWQPQRPGAGGRCTGAPGSGETASTGAAKTAAPAQRGARVWRALRTVRNVLAGWPWPIGLPTIGAAMPLLCGYRPSMPGCWPRFAGSTATAGTLPSGKTCPDGACQNLGCPPRSLARMQCSNTAAPCCTRWAQTALRTWRMAWAWLRGPGCSRPLSSTHWPACWLSSLVPETAPRSLGMLRQPAYPAPSTGPNRRDCKTAWWLCAGLVPIGRAWVSAACRSVRKVWDWACGNHIAFTAQHPIVDFLPATGEEVFNLEVAEDHTYIAAGVVVHNCDLLASQNLYGLGAGVYPSAKACPWPAHPNTLSFVEMVFAHEVTDADRAGKETAAQALGRLNVDVREGVLGKTKAEYFDKGLLRSGAFRSPLRAVEARLQRQGALPTEPQPNPSALPGYGQAEIAMGKLTGYALNPGHERGAHKARVFESALGITQANADVLERQIRDGLPFVAAHVQKATEFGTTYRADIRVTGPAGSAIVRTGWIVDATGTGVPRLTSAYVKK